MKAKQIPTKGYCNVYEYTYKDVLDNEHKEYLFGRIHKNKEDLPNSHEYDCVAHKHIGIAKITIEIMNK